MHDQRKTTDEIAHQQEVVDRQLMHRSDLTAIENRQQPTTLNPANRFAWILNGSLVVFCAIMAALRFTWGWWGLLLMGIGLILTGLSGRCGSRRVYHFFFNKGSRL